MIKFLFAEDFLSMLTFFRVLYLEGRPGAGKTYLSVLLSGHLLAGGYVNKVVSNIPISWRSEAVVPLNNACIILDESWMYINSRSDVMDYAGFVRKFNHYLLLPSVFPPHRLMTRFSVERIQNLYAYGLPGWLYRWRLDRVNVKEKGHFLVWHPHELFGYFDTKYIPADDGGISEAVAGTAGVSVRQHGKRKEEDYEDTISGIGDDLAGALDEVSKEQTDLISQVKKIRRRIS